jgi:hypothetical protein
MYKLNMWNCDPKLLKRRIRGFQRGYIEDFELWASVFGSLKPDNAVEFLDSLPDDLKALLRDEYRKPASHRLFEPPHDSDFPELKRVVKAWLERESRLQGTVHENPHPEPDVIKFPFRG